MGGMGFSAAPTGPPILDITVGLDSKLVAAGFPPNAPAITFEKGMEVFSSSAHIVGDLCEDAVIEHDADWEQYPEVAQAVKEAGGAEDCIAVAKSPSNLKWGVGLASGWQGRERAAKVALSVALARGTPQLARVAKNYPEFGAMCAANGAASPGVEEAWPAQGAPKGGEWSAGAAYCPEEPPALMNASMGMYAPAPGHPMGGAAGAYGECPPVHFIAVEPTSTLPMRGLPAEAVVVSFGGKQFKNFFQNAHSILSEMVNDVAEVQFHDDPDWKLFPEVGEAIKMAGGEENCICVATLEAAGIWAVGTAAGKKPRESAAKMALALAMAPGSEKLTQLLSNYPEFVPICAATGLEVGMVESAYKKRRFVGS